MVLLQRRWRHPRRPNTLPLLGETLDAEELRFALISERADSGDINSFVHDYENVGWAQPVSYHICSIPPTEPKGVHQVDSYSPVASWSDRSGEYPDQKDHRTALQISRHSAVLTITHVEPHISTNISLLPNIRRTPKSRL